MVDNAKESSLSVPPSAATCSTLPFKHEGSSSSQPLPAPLALPVPPAPPVPPPPTQPAPSLPAPEGSSSSLAQTLPQSQTDLQKEPDNVVPPDNFACVEQGLYRSALPTPRNLPFIQSLRLTTAVILTAEKPIPSVTNFFENHGIRVAHMGLHGWSADRLSWKPIDDDVVKETLELVLCRRNYPILLCDASGVHLVGMVVGCLRRVQHWNLNSVVNEYRSFTMSRTRYVNEQFIELFDVDLVTIPDELPVWFAELHQMQCRERVQFTKLYREGSVDSSGVVVNAPQNTPQYLVYYYSASGPLNSEKIGVKPCIQKL